MDLKDIISITGLGGLYKLESQRDNGVIVKELGQEKNRFVPTRNHDFTPLDNITIYDDGDGAELIDVFIEMKKQEAELSIPDSKASETDLATYLEKILPKYDKDQVYVSDMRKLVKWYKVLDNLKLVDTEKPKEDDSEEIKNAERNAKKAAADAKSSTKSRANPAAASGAKRTTANPRKTG